MGSTRSSAAGRALVARVDFANCVLLGDDGELLAGSARGRLMGPRKALGNAVVVGDRVRFAHRTADAEDRVMVEEVEPRRNAFSRRAAGARPTEQVVASNLDQVVIVASCADPEFSPGLTDRLLCQAEPSGLPARLVLNKVDLAAAGPGAAEAPEAVLADYGRAGYPGHAISARSGAGVAELLHACRGRRSLFVGHSGVGKSTLLNALVPALSLLAGRVNQKTGKGRHTTSAALLVRPEPGLELIDTPGVRAFGLWGIGPRDLDQAYREFWPYLGSCRFDDCVHATEPGCAIRAAAAEGAISSRRYQSYLKLRQELIDELERQTVG